MKNKIYTIISYTLAIFMCVTLLPKWVMADEQTVQNTPPEIPTTGDVWDGVSKEAPSEIIQKDGKNYYAIRTGAQLAYIAWEGETWLSKNYILMNNITLNDIMFEWDADGNFITDTTSLTEWPMLGKNSSFDGVFDGNGYSISGVWIEYSEGTDENWGLFACVGENGEIHNLSLVNSDIHSTGRWVGGIAGRSYGTITNCVNYANVIAYGKDYWSGRDAGGIVGLCDGVIKNCINNGRIIGRYDVGGIAGSLSGGSVTDSVNNGSVAGLGNNTWGNYIGGITGSKYSSGSVENCLNTGIINGYQYVGGIIGSGNVKNCANHGIVNGNSDVGGISGVSSKILNSYNIANIYGTNNVGGIIGKGDSAKISFCYSSGNICENSKESVNVGAIIGSDGAIWGSDSVEECYYLKTSTINSLNYGCGNADLLGEEPSGFYGISNDDMVKQETFNGWDFWDTWRISETRNNGYPHLAWESAKDPATMTGVSISRRSMEITTGDSAFLSATPEPENAIIPNLSWSTNAPDIAQVNKNGKVTALSPGTAVVTVTTEDGEHTASCTVTVTERVADEYRINGITVRDNAGVLLTSIPTGTCLATVSITNMASAGDTMVMLASYTADGQYQGLTWVSVEDLPVGATIKITLPVDNSNGKIASLKAFTTASFTNLVPLGNTVSFPNE